MNSAISLYKLITHYLIIIELIIYKKILFNMFIVLINLFTFTNVLHLIPSTVADFNHSEVLFHSQDINFAAQKFITSFDVYLRDKHYGLFRRYLNSLQPHLARTHHDRECLQLLNYSLLNPMLHEWTTKCMCMCVAGAIKYFKILFKSSFF